MLLWFPTTDDRPWCSGLFDGVFDEEGLLCYLTQGNRSYGLVLRLKYNKNGAVVVGWVNRLCLS